MKAKAPFVAISTGDRRLRAALAFALLLGALTLVSMAQASKGVYFTFGSAGTGDGQFFSNGSFGGPNGVAVNASGEGPGATARDVYVVDRGNHRVEQFHSDGSFVRAFGLNVGGVGVNVCTSSCVGGTNSPLKGGLSLPQGIAIDQATGNVYVGDPGNKRIDVFSANGTFQGAWGQNVDATTAGTGFEFCPATDTCQAGASTTTGIAGAFGAAIGYLAVAPAGAPNAGNVLVASSTNNRIDEFSVTLNGSEEVTGASFVRGIGWKVNATTPLEQLQTCTTASGCQAGSAGGGAGQFSANGATRVAVDTTGAIYAVNLPTPASCSATARCAVQKLNPSATSAADFAPATLTFTSGTKASQAATDVTVDPSSGHVFVVKAFAAGTGSPPAAVEERRVLEFDASGTLLDTHMAGAAVNSVNGLAFEPTLERLFLSSGTTAGKMYVLADPPDHPPLATTGDSSEETFYLQRLEGSVNPADFKVTECRFEYGPTIDYGASSTCVPGAAALGEGNADVAVSALTEPLEPNTTYHYRLRASNVAATDFGEDRAFTTGAAPPDACPNADRRAEQGIAAILLPDCMGLEQVSPPQKGGQSAQLPSISADGERVVFSSIAALGGTEGVNDVRGDRYVASRGFSGWDTEATSLPGGIYRAGWDSYITPKSFSPDFSSWFQIGSTLPQYDAGISQAFHGELGRVFTPISPLLEPLEEGGRGVVQETFFQGASADHSHLHFIPGPLADPRTNYLASDPVPPGGTKADHNTYIAGLDANGNPSLQLLARDKDGKVWGNGCGARLGGIVNASAGLKATPNGQRNQGAVSSDGSRTYFSTHPTNTSFNTCATVSPLRIMVRLESPIGPQIEELFASECDRPALPSPPGPCTTTNGDDLYQGASLDGTKVYFTTNRQLADSDIDGSTTECSNTTAVAGCDLYLYDSTMPAGERLTQVSAGENVGAHQAGKDAKVFNAITAISADGSHAYFVATGTLTGPNTKGKSPTEGQPNLYLYERDAAHPSGQLVFVGTLSGADQGTGEGIDLLGLWGQSGSFRNFAYPVPALGADGDGEQIGGDGHLLFLLSKASLTADDTDGGSRDLFRYDAQSGTIERISKAATGGADNGALDVGPRGNSSAPGTNWAEEERWVSEDGMTAVFKTAEGLVPDDVNGVTDSYLWRGGQLYRLPGTADPNGKLRDIPVLSHDGLEAAFKSFAPLLPSDRDSSADVYVARPGGGFAIQSELTPCDPLAEGACRQGEEQPAAPQIVGTPPGAANVTQAPSPRCPKGKRKVRRKGELRCVRRHPRKQRNRHRSRQANADRRAGK